MSVSEQARWGARIRYQTELWENYHTERAARLQRGRNWVQVLTIASSLPAGTLFAQRLTAEGSIPYLAEITAAFAFFIAVLAIIEQIWKHAEKVVEHRMLANQYRDIGKEIRSKALTMQDLERIQARIDGFASSEPVKPLLEAKSHNKLMQAYDFSPEFWVETGILKRAWRKLFTAYGHGLRARKNLESDVGLWVSKMAPAIAT